MIIIISSMTYVDRGRFLDGFKVVVALIPGLQELLVHVGGDGDAASGKGESNVGEEETRGEGRRGEERRGEEREGKGGVVGGGEKTMLSRRIRHIRNTRKHFCAYTL